MPNFHLVQNSCVQSLYFWKTEPRYYHWNFRDSSCSTACWKFPCSHLLCPTTDKLVHWMNHIVLYWSKPTHTFGLKIISCWQSKCRACEGEVLKNPRWVLSCGSSCIFEARKKKKLSSLYQDLISSKTAHLLKQWTVSMTDVDL